MSGVAGHARNAQFAKSLQTLDATRPVPAQQTWRRS